MIKNYLITAIRNLLRNKTYSFLNIFGLAIGITASILILEYVKLEQSYDRFHQKSENIYRINTDYIRGGKKIYYSASTFAGVGPTFKKELTEIKEYVKVYNAGSWNNCVVEINNRIFKEKKLMFATEAFFQMFSFSLLKGDPSKVLSQPNTVAISATMAKKYFGNSNPIGQTITIKDENFNRDLCRVTGVFEDIPENSHLKTEVVVAYKTLFKRTRGDRTGRDIYENDWDANRYHTYVLLHDNINLKAVEARFSGLLDTYKPRYKAVDKNGKRKRTNHLILQSLTNIHFGEDLLHELEAGGNQQLTDFLQVIALFILLIAWINYINLSTARAVHRAKEVGIRKVVGGVKRQLIGQFLLEALLLNMIAVWLAIWLADLLMPFFSQLAGKNIVFTLWQTPRFGLGIVAMLLLGAFLSGLYPAFVLSSFQPVSVLKGKIGKVGKGLTLRKGLVIFQFAASVMLIAGTVAVYFQMQYLKNQDLGFEPEQTLVLSRPSVNDTANQVRENKLKLFKRTLLENTHIKNFTSSSRIPGIRHLRGTGISRQKTIATGIEGVKVVHFIVTDKDFLDTYRIKLIQGRKFDQQIADTSSVILSETALKELDFVSVEDALGKTVYLYGEVPRKVIGITQDIHQESLEKAAFPTLFLPARPNAHNRHTFYSVRLKAQNLPVTLGFIQNQWDKIYPGNPFEYFFLDDFFNRQYRSSQQFSQVFGVFAGLAIFVACLGLFGLSSFTTFQRTKEVGIRKVLGASVKNIMWLLTKNFLQLTFIASLIALPLAYWGIQQWLQNFAHRITIGWWLFAIPLGLVVLLTVITVSFQTLKAAWSNPVDSLRYE
ncbi:hypothetical protein BKI52_12805 [marine bacterium AO1-C]|nr:hypothetical protein BKI52_12805 [marine bacterium AO1-C]